MSDFRTCQPLADWQAKNGYLSNQVSPHIAVSEVDDDSRELIINEIVLDMFEKIRKEYGKPLKINSGYRTQKKQAELIAKGYKAAAISPHCQGWALDIDYNTDEEYRHLLVACHMVSTISYNGYLRIGHKQYRQIGQTFIHVDICAIAYESLKGKFSTGEVMPAHWKIRGAEW
jgi:hypothetical protein